MDRLPNKRGGPITVIGALRHDGLAALMSVNGGTNTDVFQVYVDQVLLPELSPGDIVVLDNLAAHKAASVRQSIESAGCRLVFQAPYSPDLNPIELAWSKVKNFLRTARARTRDVLDMVLGWCLDLISPTDAINWFRHCGVQGQLT